MFGSIPFSKHVRHTQWLFHSFFSVYFLEFGTLCFSVCEVDGYVMFKDDVFFAGVSAAQLLQINEQPQPSSPLIIPQVT